MTDHGATLRDVIAHAIGREDGECGRMPVDQAEQLLHASGTSLHDIADEIRRAPDQPGAVA